MSTGGGGANCNYPPSPTPSSSFSKTATSANSSTTTLTNVTNVGLYQISTDLLHSAEWLHFLTKVNRFNFIDDASSVASSVAPRPNVRIVTLDNAVAIGEARRVIGEEASALRLLSDGLIGLSFAKVCELILKTKGRVIVSGLSKGGHIERRFAALLAATGSPAFYLHPDDLTYHGELDSINEGDLFIVLSQNGTIGELMPALLRCERLDIPIIGVTAKRSSNLGEIAQIILEVPEIAEACSITSLPTTSAHCMMAYGEAVAICTHRARRGLESCDYHVQQSTWRQKLVRDVMSTDPLKLPVTVLGSCRLREAIPKLLYSHTGLVGVVNEQGQLSDALTDSDIRLMAKSNSPNVTVEEALIQANANGRTSALTLGHCVLLADEQVIDAVVKMSAQSLRGAFVINEVGDTVGFLSLADCLEAGVLPTSVISSSN